MTRLPAALTLLACLLAAAACESANGTEPTEQPSPSESDETVAEATGEELVAQADPSEVIPIERYPTIAFALLEPDERVRFVELAEAELCPCEGQVSSLDSCLQSSETSCSLAHDVGALMMRLIKEDADDTEISEAVQTNIQNARQVHDLDVEGAPWKGAEDPQVLIVEFSDFQCPHCRALAPILDQIVEANPDTVRVVFQQFPLASHPDAFDAAVATLAAHRQDAFWDYHDVVFENQQQLNLTDDAGELFLRWAEQLGLNLERFQADLEDEELSLAVQLDRQEGLEAGIDSTPTMFINGVRYIDAISVEAIQSRVDSLLAE